MRMFVVVLLLSVLMAGTCRAGQETQWQEIDSFLEECYRGTELETCPSFTELVHAIMGGDRQGIRQWVKKLFDQTVILEMQSVSHLAYQVLALGILASLFAGFSKVFPGERIAGTAEFMTSMMLGTVLAAAFLDSAAVTEAALRSQMNFVRVLLPAYCMAAAWSGSAAASAAWLELLLFVLAVMEGLYLGVLLPMTKLEAVLTFVSNMSGEKTLDKMTGLIKDAVIWGARSLPAIVIGFQLVQGMVLPVADAVQTAGLQKIMGMVPGIGQGAGAAVKLLLGSSVLIRNSMGAAIVVILGVISLVPLLKLGLLTILYRMASALLQPAADSHIVEMIEGIAEGERLLFGLVFYGMSVFLLAIALVCASANMTWMAM